MAYIRCGTIDAGAKMPDSITVSGTIHTSYYGGRDQNPNDSGGGSKEQITIPTLGYKYADISATSSIVGTGNNRDVSKVTSITVTINSEIPAGNKNWHGAYQYLYGSVDTSYTVKLHN